MENKNVVVNRTSEEAQWILLQKQCKAWLSSQLLPPSVNDIAKAVTIVMAGRELGLPPLTSLREINIVQGKPCFSSQIMLAMVYQKVPGSVINFITPADRQSLECTVEVSRPGGKPQQFRYTMEMAKNAGLTGKSNWKNHPEAMLRARAVASAVRAVYPDALSSCYLPDELGHEVVDIENHESAAQSTPETQNQPVLEKATTQQTGDTPAYTERKLAKLNEPCSEPQRKKLYAMTRSLGWSKEESKEWLFEKFGKESSTEMSKLEMQDAFEQLEQMKPQALSDDAKTFLESENRV